VKYFSWKEISISFINVFFGHAVVNKLYELGCIPEDQYSKKGSIAKDSKLSNRLTMDLSRQFHLQLIAISADADKC
jgi:hypothetical protein